MKKNIVSTTLILLFFLLTTNSCSTQKEVLEISEQEKQVFESETDEAVKISDEELEKRRKAWVQPALKHQSGVLYKYAKTVSTASEGCVTDKF